MDTQEWLTSTVGSYLGWLRSTYRAQRSVPDLDDNGAVGFSDRAELPSEAIVVNIPTLAVGNDGQIKHKKLDFVFLHDKYSILRLLLRT